MLRNITEANHFIEIVENDGFIVPMIGYIRHYMLGYPTWEEREEAKRFIAEHGEDADIIIKQIRALASQSGDDAYTQHLSRVLGAVEALFRETTT